MNTIYFYSLNDEHGYMSNFARYRVKIDGKWWKTTEHYYQAQKFVGTKYESMVRKANGPAEAAAIGRDHSLPLRPDWESVKDDVMRKAVLAKFRQHKDIRGQLLATNDAILIEKTTNDVYWGCGSYGKGKNMLGIILMETRNILRNKKDLIA